MFKSWVILALVCTVGVVLLYTIKEVSTAYMWGFLVGSIAQAVAWYFRSTLK